MDLTAAFNLTAWLCAGIDAAIASAALGVVLRRSSSHRAPPAREHHSPSTIRALLGGICVALACAAAAWTLKAVAFKVVGVNWFGLVRLAYYDIALVPAALGLRAAWAIGGSRTARGVPRFWGLGAVAAGFAPAVVSGYASFAAPYQLSLEHQPFPLQSRRDARASVKVGVLADLQTDRITSYERGAIRRLLAEEPDLLLLAGDYFQLTGPLWRREWSRHALWPEFRSFMQTITAPAGAFAVLGDVDSEKRTRELVEGSRVRLLVNEVAVVQIKGTQIAVAGVELDYDSPAAAYAIKRLSEADADIRLLLSHRPDVALRLAPEDRVDLVVTGHTHGGQVVIPGFGPVITLSRVPREVAAGGLHRLGDQWIYVSRGLGFERGLAPPVRFWCPPEITVLTLGPEP